MRKAPSFREYITENKDLVRFTLHVGRVNSQGSSMGEPEQVDSTSAVRMPGTKSEWLLPGAERSYSGSFRKAIDQAVKKFAGTIAKMQKSGDADFNDGSTYYEVKVWIGDSTSELSPRDQASLDSEVERLTR